MSRPAAPVAAVEQALGGAVTAAHGVAGGDINDAWVLDLEGGERAFVKTRPDAPPGEYTAEAAGLRWLAEAGAVRVAEVLAVRDHDEPRLLALRWIERGRLDAEGIEELGRGLARLHAAGAPAFGSTPPGTPAPAGWGDAAPPLRLGPLLLPNDALDDWPTFYAERRLRPLIGPALERGALSSRGARAVEAVCERIADLAGPPEPPARLHGDLWGGNVLAGADGRAHLVDPAAHGGHREVDLAMLRLFGNPGPRLFRAYDEEQPLADGHAERVALWQLLPLLVHAVLFGGGYGDAVQRAASRYADA